jgi:transposase-like protein
MSVKRVHHSKKIKFEAALALIAEKHSLSELSQKYGVHQSVLQRWKKDLLENGAELFARGGKPKTEQQEMAALQRKVGQLTMELDFLKKHSGNERGSKAGSYFPAIKTVYYMPVHLARVVPLNPVLQGS